ncbi:Asp-tRNA(Asn)/Glu-tRNA(Gln) amidotransferase subunit GatB [Patescibacteria group bacterium]|nr:Asp-tRNA(Asn)/Glu-tRNA(Gln) amidotransferase subunit GatB [Patescibacteria group bacterium]
MPTKVKKITPIIGLEVHLELSTKSKMFCGCSASHFHVPPNIHTCPVCLGLPGALPVPNQKALDYCVKIGLALGCSVQKDSFFERKNYFYPDLPKGFQISQYQRPLTVKGKFNSVRINRVHMEEDTAKSVHQDNVTLIDFNRSGVPLVEIVSEPDIKSAQKVKQYLLDLQQLIRYLGVSDADIEKGSMRCEPTVNIKVDGKPTALVEIKNIASLSAVESAIDYEISRQTQNPDFSKNKTTRGWDADKQVTFLQRSKEGSSDYRYFPEPDIPPFTYSSATIKKIKNSLPQLPAQKVKYYQSLGLSSYDAKLLAQDQDFAFSFDSCLPPSPSPDLVKFCANIFLGPLRQYLNQEQATLSPSKIKKLNLPSLFIAVDQKQVSFNTAKEMVIKAYQTSQKSVLDLIKNSGLLQISDQNQLEEIAKKVIATNPKAVGDYQKNPNSIGFLVGQVMTATKGSANPQLVQKILKQFLN